MPGTADIFFAHSLPDADVSRWQPLSEHLSHVGRRAGEFARFFNAEALATVSGHLHDIGKYTVPFQARLRGNPLRVDHST